MSGRGKCKVKVIRDDCSFFSFGLPNHVRKRSKNQTFDKEAQIFDKSLFSVPANVSNGVNPVESRNTNKRQVLLELKTLKKGTNRLRILLK